MVVIGGLIADENNDSDTGVPFLQDVPVLGYVFKRSTISQVRRNLLTFITPRIIKDQFDARDTTISQREKAGALIEGNDVYPDRKDLLESDAIDHVAEKEYFRGDGPGTLLPPEGASNGSGPNQVLGSGAAGQPEPEHGETNSKGNLDTVKVGADKVGAGKVGAGIVSTGKVRGTLSFKAKRSSDGDGSGDKMVEGEQAVGSNAPSKKAGESSSGGDAANAERSDVSVAKNQAARTQPLNGALTIANSEVIVNLKLLDSPKEPTALPFSLSAGSTLSIVIPKESLLSTKEFFQVGAKYSYLVGKVELPMQVLSRSLSGGSQQGGSSLGEDVYRAQLYRLSPYEIMNLGKGPWLRR